MHGLIHTMGARWIAGLGVRRLAARAGRFLSSCARLDLPNDPRRNGEYRLLRELLARESDRTQFVAIDVGANVGDWTLQLVRTAAELRRSVRVIAFEASETTFKQLAARLDGKSEHVEVIHCGVSSQSGQGILFEIGALAGSNSLHPPMDGQPLQKYEIRLTSLDDFFAERGLQFVHLVKIDTEGHDLSVLEGARNLLEQHRIGCLQFEYNWRWIANRSYLLDAFRLAEKWGYRLGKVTPLGIEGYRSWHPELESFREGNYALVLPEVFDSLSHFPWWNES
jgi:FkbM family methyltransferase